ncbi:MAG TPA: head GIN domain-containing protein [Verrucomicrobiae bacterium]
MKMACLPVLCFAVVNISSCSTNSIQGSGVAKTETRTVPAFSKIELAGSPDVEVTVGPAVSLTITGDDNVMPLIDTEVKGETLEIGSHDSYSSRTEVKLKITVPSLEHVGISGSGNIHATGVKAGEMDAGITGSGNLEIVGTADRLNAHITGSGNLKAEELAAKHVHVTVTGSGDAKVRATDEIEANITGSGNVRYAGNPAQVKKSVVGSGDIAAE